uniref:CHAT domain-containing protein n=1 Tax=Desertifilum tharense IPPAS B-1220 TaxID=1781255 RepID=A0ACD5H0U1_9CYAN
MEVSGKVEDLKTSLQQPLFAEEDRELSEEFYQILIQKAENILTRHPPETLVFVLDDLLRNLPMSALFDGERYLIEKYPIAQTPGIQLLQAQRIQKSPYVLAAGVSEANQGQPPLPGVIQEIENIQSYFPRTQPLINEQFTKNEFNQKLNQPQFSIVHLATHGQFSSQVENTFLLVWQDTLNIRELNQLLQERSQIEDTPIQLLVLSACQTAAGDRRAALGLAGVAVRSGARSTIATLWLIPDESTAKLTNELYQLLAQPISLAKALQTAQISILREYTEPYYWAAYTLIGNWR